MDNSYISKLVVMGMDKEEAIKNSQHMANEINNSYLLVKNWIDTPNLNFDYILHTECLGGYEFELLYDAKENRYCIFVSKIGSTFISMTNFKSYHNALKMYFEAFSIVKV